MSRPVGPWMRLEIYMTGMEKEWSNIFWLRAASGSVNNITYNFPLAGADFLTWWIPKFAPLMSTNAKARGVYLLSNDGTSTVGFDYYQDAAGTNLTTPVPEDVAAVVTEITGTAGRSGRGRIYISGLCNDQIEGSYLSLAGATNVTTIANAMTMTVNLAGVNFQFFLYSPKLNTLTQLARCGAVALLGTSRKRKARF